MIEVIKKAVSEGKRISSILIAGGMVAAPKVAPLLAPEYAAWVPVYQEIAPYAIAALLGWSKAGAMIKGKETAN